MPNHKPSSLREGRAMTCKGLCLADICCWCGREHKPGPDMGTAIVFGDAHNICSPCVSKWVPNPKQARTIRQLLFGSGPKQKETKTHG